MELASEDLLRLNVLIKNVEAVRIDEHNMTVCGLSARGEARVTLNPTCGADRYLRGVREFLSGAALGSPGGYPVFLNRWTRMGEIKATYLAELLMLGEPEAVTAVARSEALTPELARKAWWAAPTSDHARRMLERERIVRDELGRELAQFLVEHLPFETEAATIIESIRLVLQPGLIDEAERQKLWDKGAKKSAYRIGFLRADPGNLPHSVPAHPGYESHREPLAALADSENSAADLLLNLLGGTGQAFLDTCEQAFKRPSDQDAVVHLVNSMAAYFRAVRFHDDRCRDMDRIASDAAVLWDSASRNAGAPGELTELARAVPQLHAEAEAMLVLARCDEEVITPVFAQTDAVGTVMRRKLEPVTTPILQRLATLRGAAAREPG